jgi:hypothetical protein
MKLDEQMVLLTKIVTDMTSQRSITVKELLHEIEQELHMKQLRKVLMK